MKIKQNKKGFALTEVLLAIAVIVIIGIAAYPLYKNARLSSQVESEANDIITLQTNTQVAFRGQSNYVALGTNGMMVMDQLGLVPKSMESTDPTFFSNSWGGRVTLDFSISTNGNPVTPHSGFSIMIADLPTDACVKLGTRLAPAFIGVGSTDSAGDIKGDVGSMNQDPPKTFDLSALSATCNTVPDPGVEAHRLYFTSQ